MKYLPIGNQNFEEIIKKDLLYVDKTRQIYELLQNGKLYFLSRPRRFGKSLLVSKFRYLFSGRKDLFENLYIGKTTDYAFEKYPILQFNFSAYGYKVENLRELLANDIEKYAAQFAVETDKTSLGNQFQTLIEGISQKDKPVVLLIDEYDTPITNFLTEVEKAKNNQKVLKDFFSPLKNLDANGHLHFLFITGVSKFSKVSLFSDLNNLKDLTVNRWSHDLVGITQEELLAYFPEHIKATADYLDRSEDQLLADVKFWYNGYAYDPKIKLYNPFSLLNFFDARRFANFWFATGTPTFLVETIRNQAVFPKELEEVVVMETFFDKYSLERLDAIGLLFQTGYLTIKATETRRNRTKYYLGYPNEEVRLSLTYNLVEAFTFKRSSTVSEALVRMEEGLEDGEVGKFVEQLTILLSDISYHLLPRKKHKKQTAFEVWEGYFQTIIYLVTSFMGFHVQSEITKHKGRLDLFVETDDYIYLMEFKLDEPAKNALEQIKNREYAAAYKNTPKTLYLVGINFSKEERNVEDWDAEIWER
ncbi:MAG: ATP-binding protein [Bacteroidota bacterium]